MRFRCWKVGIFALVMPAVGSAHAAPQYIPSGPAPKVLLNFSIDSSDSLRTADSLGCLTTQSSDRDQAPVKACLTPIFGTSSTSAVSTTPAGAVVILGTLTVAGIAHLVELDPEMSGLDSEDIRNWLAGIPIRVDQSIEDLRKLWTPLSLTLAKLIASQTGYGAGARPVLPAREEIRTEDVGSPSEQLVPSDEVFPPLAESRIRHFIHYTNSPGPGLVVGRQEGEKIHIGESTVVTVRDFNGTGVELTIRTDCEVIKSFDRIELTDPNGPITIESLDKGRGHPQIRINAPRIVKIVRDNAHPLKTR